MEEHKRQALEQRLNRIETFQNNGMALEEKLRMRISALEMAVASLRKGENPNIQDIGAKLRSEFGQPTDYWGETDRASSIEEVLARLR